MKVYIVTAGEYSGYHIEKVFTDKAKAEEFAEWCYDSNGVEEWDTEDNLEVNKYYQISVEYTLNDNGRSNSLCVNVWRSTEENCYQFTCVDDYHKYGGKYVRLRFHRKHKDEGKSKAFYKEKYTKVAYDLAAMVKQLHVDGYSWEQINEMLRNDNTK